MTCQNIGLAAWLIQQPDVILDPETKKDIQNDVLRFFRSRERYDKLRVPWKRGIIVSLTRPLTLITCG